MSTLIEQEINLQRLSLNTYKVSWRDEWVVGVDETWSTNLACAQANKSLP